MEFDGIALEMLLRLRAGAGYLGLVSAVVLAAIGSAKPSQALTISPLFDSSVTGSANAANYESAVNTAISRIEGLYSDPGTVSIVFKYAFGSFLGQSSTARASVSYNLYTNALALDAAANPQNNVLTTALANLSKGNDANGAMPISATEALLRVGLNIGGLSPCFNASGSFISGCVGGSYDGVVTLSKSYGFSFSEPFSTSSNKYDAIATFEHEINEILGGGGQGSSVGSSSAYGPLDVYRYSAPNTPSFSTAAPSSYFSIDGGVTNIVNFYQGTNGDYGDFAPQGYVQSAQTNWNTQPTYTTSSPDYKMMLSIGWDPVPEPATIALFTPALLALRLLGRRRG